MLRIYPVILDWIESLRGPLRAIERCDRNLALQLRRAATAVGLSVGEGMGAFGGRKRSAYRVALGEMREAVAAIDIAIRFGFIEPMAADEVDRQDRIVGTLINLSV